MAHAKTQHYVSRLYLRQFAYETGKNPRICAFDKTDRRIIRPTIKNIAAELHFYESDDTGVERALTKIEDTFVPAYKTARELDDIESLGTWERAAIAVFIAVQQIRTVEFRATLKSMVSGLDDWAKRHDARLDPSYTSITEEQCRDIQLTSLATLAPTIAMGAGTMKWIRLHNRTTMPLWTSDHPIAMYNPKPKTLMGNLGWGCPGIQVFFPLSPEIALCICDPEEYAAQPTEIQTNDIAHVMLLNELQVRQATRFVLSKTADFDLANRILNAFPDVGDLNRKRMQTN